MDKWRGRNKNKASGGAPRRSSGVETKSQHFGKILLHRNHHTTALLELEKLLEMVLRKTSTMSSSGSLTGRQKEKRLPEDLRAVATVLKSAVSNRIAAAVMLLTRQAVYHGTP